MSRALTELENILRQDPKYSKDKRQRISDCFKHAAKKKGYTVSIYLKTETKRLETKFQIIDYQLSKLSNVQHKKIKKIIESNKYYNDSDAVTIMKLATENNVTPKYLIMDLTR
jgi:hypothetical protein